MLDAALQEAGSWRRALGVGLAATLAAAPALPLGPVFAQPPLPIAGLWLAYGLAAQGGGGWRAPALVFALGLLQDLFAGVPFGFYGLLYLGSFVISNFTSRLMRSDNLLSPWTGFSVTALGVFLLSLAAAPAAIGAGVEFGPLALALTVTAALFPLAMPLYLYPESGANRA